MNRRLVCKALATLGPIGILPASGTCATVLTVPFAYILARTGLYEFWVLGITVAAYFIIRCVLPLFMRKDPQEVVLDEAIGCLWVLYAADWSIAYILSAILLFRFFDITKIMGICLFERLPGAWGIIADDCAAALWAFCVLYGIRLFL